MVWLVMMVMMTRMAMTLTSFNLHFCWTMCSCRLSDTEAERQTRGNTGRAFESLALWGFGWHLWILHQMQIIANLCPLQRASSTSIAFQVNSDSTRTFGQAQSSSSDAVAEQLRQEIGSLRAKAAQVPCPSSHYSSFCIVFLSRLLDKMGPQYQTNIQLQCDATRYRSSKKSLLKLRRGRYDAMSAGLPVYQEKMGRCSKSLYHLSVFLGGSKCFDSCHCWTATARNWKPEGAVFGGPGFCATKFKCR